MCHTVEPFCRAQSESLPYLYMSTVHGDEGLISPVSQLSPISTSESERSRADSQILASTSNLVPVLTDLDFDGCGYRRYRLLGKSIPQDLEHGTPNY